MRKRLKRFAKVTAALVGGFALCSALALGVINSLGEGFASAKTTSGPDTVTQGPETTTVDPTMSSMVFTPGFKAKPPCGYGARC